MIYQNGIFYIIKDADGFWHRYNNDSKNVSISDFEVVLDEVANTFMIQCKNGSNIPNGAVLCTDIVVVDSTSGGSEELFPTVSLLKVRLEELGYTPYFEVLFLPIESGTATGTALTFLTDRVYGTVASPETGNITATITGAKLGVTNIVIHDNGTEPTFDAKFKKLSGSGSYVTGEINYIFCCYINDTEIIYSINQRT